MILRHLITLCLLCAALTARAAVLELPWPSEPLAEQREDVTSHFLATGPYIDGPLEGVNAEGSLLRQSWRVDGEFTTVQLLAPLRRQFLDAGFETFFECETNTCGGFDFRFQIDIFPEPDMHVNLGDFRYLAAKRTSQDEADEYIGLVVSRSANAGFVYLAFVGADGATIGVEASVASQSHAKPSADAKRLAEQLEQTGHASLDDLEFGTGSSQLGDATFASLADLASYLNSRPERTIVLVGHTDAVGSLDSNIELSRMRASAVLERLIQRHGVPRSQVSAYGVGFLAPRTDNLTEEGRARNRRVEAVLDATR